DTRTAASVITGHGLSRPYGARTARISSTCDSLGSRMCGIGSNRRRILLDLPDRFRYLAHVLLVTQQRKLRNPDCLPRRPLCMREALVQDFVFLCCLGAAEAFAIFTSAQAVEYVQGRMFCLC